MSIDFISLGVSFVSFSILFSSFFSESFLFSLFLISGILSTLLSERFSYFLLDSLTFSSFGVTKLLFILINLFKIFSFTLIFPNDLIFSIKALISFSYLSNIISILTGGYFDIFSFIIFIFLISFSIFIQE